jgi:2-polyprenyl-3-methyl-5-hydroxy-6-metoxy-1,4-benzoquinol methylase
MSSAMNTSSKIENRFESDAKRYAEYLKTPEGRLRIDLTLATVQEFLPPTSGVESLRALDIGGGTGAAALRLARLGINVTVFDSSVAMLELAEKTIAEAELSAKVKIQLGDIGQLSTNFEAASFDVILCHNVLEFVDDPAEVIRSAVRLMRNSSSILSVLVRNQAGEVLKAALLNGDLTEAERTLREGWGQESLYGGKVRLFTPEGLETILTDAQLTLKAQRGVRVFADYLPEQISRSAEYERILALERTLGKRKEFVSVARYIHSVAHPGASQAKVDE